MSLARPNPRLKHDLLTGRTQDQASKGAAAISLGDFSSAVTHYTNAISLNPHAVDYYIKRSTAYTRVSPPDYQAALKDAELAVGLAVKRAKRELIAQAQLRRAIALFSLERWADAQQCFQWVKKLNEKEKSLAIWEMKVGSKMKTLEDGDEWRKATVKEVPEGEIPDTPEEQKTMKSPKSPEEAKATANGTTVPPKLEGVQTPANQIRHEWFQTNDTVVVTLFCKGIPKDKAIVEIKQGSLEVSFPLPTGSDFNLSLDPLFSKIDVSASNYKIMSTKAEFTLKKSTSGQKWSSIEGVAPVETEGDASHDSVQRAVLAYKTINTVPAYPTSSKSGPKNWDKVASELSKKPKPEKEGDEGADDATADAGIEDEEGDPTTNFFKMLYKGADEDTRRAMMKSYQESNGTALSTNWAEVGKGKVETSPPDGMEARKWGE